MSQITTKEIASIAGVSVGTVDRVIHNRGQVADKTRKKIQEIIDKNGYQPNLIARNLVQKKKLKIVTILPTYQAGGYWSKVWQGIHRAENELRGQSLSLEPIFYDIKKPESLLKSISKIRLDEPIGLILSPSSKYVCLKIINYLKTSCEKFKYIFVDTNYVDLQPLAFFGQDASKSGALCGKLMSLSGCSNKQFTLYIQNDDVVIQKTIQDRIEGLLEYIKNNNILCEPYKMTTKQIYSELNSGTVNQKNILFIPHSRANKVIEELNLKQLSKLNLTIGYDITNDNEYLLRNDKIDILINQNPELQGYMAVQTIYKNHFFNYDIEPNNYFPIEIVTKENIDFIQKF